jgi:hypothetical protein
MATVRIFYDVHYTINADSIWTQYKVRHNNNELNKTTLYNNSDVYTAA